MVCDSKDEEASHEGRSEGLEEHQDINVADLVWSEKVEQKEREAEEGSNAEPSEWFPRSFMNKSRSMHARPLVSVENDSEVGTEWAP